MPLAFTISFVNLFGRSGRFCGCADDDNDYCSRFEISYMKVVGVCAIQVDSNLESPSMSMTTTMTRPSLNRRVIGSIDFVSLEMFAAENFVHWVADTALPGKSTENLSVPCVCERNAMRVMCCVQQIKYWRNLSKGNFLIWLKRHARGVCVSSPLV